MIKRKPTSSPRMSGEKQNIDESVMERARHECDFSDRLYDIILEFQRRGAITRKIKSAAMGNVGELNLTHTQLYNAIWDAALNVTNGGNKHKTSMRTNRTMVERQRIVDASYDTKGVCEK